MRFALALSFSVLSIATFGNAQMASANDHLPACTNDKVLKKVAKRFNQTEKRFWKERGLVFNAIHHPHLHSDYNLADSEIERRYCHGTAVFENGKNRKMHYLIESNAGFAGFGWRVVYCVHGLDPWKYNDGYCRTLSR